MYFFDFLILSHDVSNQNFWQVQLSHESVSGMLERCIIEWCCNGVESVRFNGLLSRRSRLSEGVSGPLLRSDFTTTS